MRRLARFVFAALAAGSLLACVAACVLWARSYSAAGFDSHIEATAVGGTGVVRREASVSVSRGNFVYVHSSRTRVYPDAQAVLVYLAAMGDHRDGHASRFRYGWFAPRPLVLAGYGVTDLGVVRFASQSGWSGYEWAAMVPGWSLAPALAVLPGLWAYSWRRRRAAPGGAGRRAGAPRRASA